jgi:hypothetical protein
VKESNGKIVWQQLKKAIEKTGIPRETLMRLRLMHEA